MTSTMTTTQVDSQHYLMKEEIHDPDCMEAILRDTQFSATDKRHLGLYKKSRSHGARNSVIYDYGKECRVLQIGRLFAKHFTGLQSFSRDIRNPLLQKNYWDVDIVNCHYWLMYEFSQKNGLKNTAISQYCNHRDQELSKVSLDRDLAKMCFLKTAYGGNVHLHDTAIVDDGEEPDGDLSLIKAIQSEISTIIKYVKGAYPEITKLANDICKKKKEWADKKGKKIYWNADFTTLGLVLQTEERKCLLSIDNTLKQNGRSMDVLIHDGGLVRKLADETSFPCELMRLAEKNVKTDLGYTIRLAVKPIKHNFKLPDKKADVIDDEYASRVFIELMKNNVIRSGRDVYIYNDTIGMWDNDENAYRCAVAKNKHKLIFTTSDDKVYNYGGSEKNVMAMRKWLFSSIEFETVIDITNSKGSLLFSDGWYDMDSKFFNEGFELCRDKFFMKRIDRPFNPMRNYELENNIKKILFENPFNNKKIGNLYMNIIAIGISGNAMKIWPTVVGNTNCGKTTITITLKYVFGDYVGEFNLNNLKFNPRGGDDEAKKLAWLSDLRYCRINISNEARMDGRSLDGNQMKALSSGGDSIMLRTNHKDQVSLQLMSMFISLMNDMCPIQPCDQALKNRLLFLPFTKSFVNKPQCECNAYEMESDVLLKDKLKNKEWIDAFFWIIMDSYNNGNLIEIPPEVLAEGDELLVIEDVKLKKVLLEKYEFVETETETDYVCFSDISKYLIESGIKMSDTKIGRELKKMGLVKKDKKIGKRTCTVYYGLNSD